MPLHRWIFTTRHAVLSALLPVFAVGVLRAQADAAGKKQMIPLHSKPVAAGKPAVSAKPAKSMVSVKPAKPTKPMASAKPVSARRTGAQVYRQLCASCHGAKGEGGTVFKKPLRGEKSVGELARFIHQYMPPGADPKLPMEDARSVAGYLHDEFYSPVARARNKPARVELSRLTVRQYRNAVTDLLGSFRKTEAVDEQRGLSAKYFKTRKNDKPILERVDPEIRFDYGTGGALPEQDDPYQFTMVWDGSVLAPDTGEYEFIVRTEHGVTLWVNDMRRPLIDAQVKSGSGTEQRASLFLLGGRRYPLRLEFFKGVAGVNDLKKLKEKPPQKASLALEWRLPKRAAEVIPQRCLFPTETAPTFVAATPFPPDDRSIGYERGASVSKEWDEATTEAALETAGYVAAHLSELSGVPDDAPERRAKLREFCRKFATRAFRRPLSDEQARFFVERQFRNAPNTETAVKRVVLLTLKSPRFLYREIGAPLTSAATVPVATSPAPTAPVPAAPSGAAKIVPTALEAKPSAAPTTAASIVAPKATPSTVIAPTKPATPATATPATATPPIDPYDVASRLSFAMWDSLPDEELLKAAAEGRLVTREQVMQQAQRLGADPRAWSKLREFLLQWLKVEHYPDLAKDAKSFPTFNETIATDLRNSFEMSLEHIVWNEKSDFRELLLTDKFFLNGRLAWMYGALLASDAPFQQVALDPGRRAGLLTHPYLLASFSYLDTSSPIHRGVLIARSMLGRTLQPPPAAFVPLAANLHPKMTTRQRVALQTRPAACMPCHSLINPLGFSLEKFDAIGRLRARENGVWIDATGGYRSRLDQEVKFSGASDLARYLADSEEVHAAFIEKLFQYTVKQPIRAFGAQTSSGLQRVFKTNGFNIRRQMVETAVLSALHRPLVNIPKGKTSGVKKPDSKTPSAKTPSAKTPSRKEPGGTKNGIGTASSGTASSRPVQRGDSPA